MAELTQIEVWMHGRLVGRLGLTPDKPRTCAFDRRDDEDLSPDVLQCGYRKSR